AVYTATAVTVTAAVSFVLWKLFTGEAPTPSSSPSASGSGGDSRASAWPLHSGTSSETSSGSGSRLRKVLEGLSKDEVEACPHSGPGRPVSGPLSVAAQLAAASGRVWWLERCGASPACRTVL
ncbi:unnamed protein product, partial [Polarella glacialis]